MLRSSSFFFCYLLRLPHSNCSTLGIFFLPSPYIFQNILLSLITNWSSIHLIHPLSLMSRRIKAEECQWSGSGKCLDNITTFLCNRGKFTKHSSHYTYQFALYRGVLRARWYRLQRLVLSISRSNIHFWSHRPQEQWPRSASMAGLCFCLRRDSPSMLRNPASRNSRTQPRHCLSRSPAENNCVKHGDLRSPKPCRLFMRNAVCSENGLRMRKPYQSSI